MNKERDPKKLNTFALFLSGDSDDKQGLDVIKLQNEIQAEQYKKVIDLEIEKINQPLSEFMFSRSEVRHVPNRHKLQDKEVDDKKSQKTEEDDKS